MFVLMECKVEFLIDFVVVPAGIYRFALRSRIFFLFAVITIECFCNILIFVNTLEASLAPKR